MSWCRSLLHQISIGINSPLPDRWSPPTKPPPPTLLSHDNTSHSAPPQSEDTQTKIITNTPRWIIILSGFHSGNLLHFPSLSSTLSTRSRNRKKAPGMRDCLRALTVFTNNYQSDLPLMKADCYTLSVVLYHRRMMSFLNLDTCWSAFLPKISATHVYNASVHIFMNESPFNKK